MPIDYVKLDVLCPSCGEDHDDLEFGVNVNEDSDWPYLGRCPKTNRVIYAQDRESDPPEWGPDSVQQFLECGPR